MLLFWVPVFDNADDAGVLVLKSRRGGTCVNPIDSLDEIRMLLKAAMIMSIVPTMVNVSP